MLQVCSAPGALPHHVPNFFAQINPRSALGRLCGMQPELAHSSELNQLMNGARNDMSCSHDRIGTQDISSGKCDSSQVATYPHIPLTLPQREYILQYLANALQCSL